MNKPTRTAAQLRELILDAVAATAYESFLRDKRPQEELSDDACLRLAAIVGQLWRAEPEIAHALATAAGLGEMFRPGEL
ncbi:hypothetical protein AB4851_08635 [Burkholderia sp. 22PA0099]|uniref:hypothetical protein n=1 Tax=Burkholderia sp. 22PA0099 TaxID=3237372 RepID=UPI0039C21131